MGQGDPGGEYQGGVVPNARLGRARKHNAAPEAQRIWSGYWGLTCSALGVRKGRNRDGISGRGRGMLGAPLGAGAAHVVLFRAVGIDQRSERTEEFREIAGEAGCFAGLTGHDTLLRPLSAVGAGSTGLLFRRR